MFVTFDLSAFGRARSVAQETLDVRRDQFLVFQQTAHVQVIVRGNIRAGGRVQRRRRQRRQRRLSTGGGGGGAADRRQVQRRQNDSDDERKTRVSISGRYDDSDVERRRSIHVHAGSVVAAGMERKKKSR